MRILVITQKSPFPAIDGGSVAFLNGLACLSEVADYVQLLSFNTSSKKDLKAEWPLWLKEKYHADCISINTSHSVFKFIKSIFSTYAYILYRFIDKKVVRKIDDIVEQNQIDCVIFESIYTGVYIDFIKNKTIKTILKVHNVEHLIWLDLIQRMPPLKKIAIRLATFKLKQNEIDQSKKHHQTVAFSNIDAQFFESYAKSIQVIGLQSPLTDAAINELKPIDHQTFFHLAAMDWLPNVEALDWLLNEVWPLVKIKSETTQLYLAGKNMPDRFRSLENKGIYVKEAKVAAHFIQENGVMLVPLFSGSGIRVKIIEGMSLGRCIICTSKALLGIEAEAGKHILVADDAENFAKKMVDCFQNQTMVNQIGNSAAIFAREHFSKKQIELEWKTLLDNLNN